MTNYMSTGNENYMGESALSESPRRGLGLKIKDGAVTTEKIADGAVTLPKLGSDVSAHIDEEVSTAVGEGLSGVDAELANLQNQILGIVQHGVAVSTTFGQNDYISISQRALTDEINHIWDKIEDITGESLDGITMTVSPEYFLGDEGCDLLISANSAAAKGKFEVIRFFISGVEEPIYEAENVETLSFQYHIDDTVTIRCEAKILGRTYTLSKTIEKTPAFYMAAGGHYNEVTNQENLIQFTHGMRANKDVEFQDGQYLILVMANSFLESFIRVDMNGFEIPLDGPVAVPGAEMSYFMSTGTFRAGEYNIDING